MATLSDWITTGLARGATCFSCRKALTRGEAGSYGHDGGYDCSDMSERQWIFFRCSSCGTETSLGSLGVERR